MSSVSKSIRFLSVFAVVALVPACGEGLGEAGQPLAPSSAVEQGQADQEVTAVCPQCISSGAFWSIGNGWANGYACAPYYPTQYYIVKIYRQTSTGWSLVGTGKAEQFQSSIFTACGSNNPFSYYHGFGVSVSQSGPGYYKMEAYNPNGTSFGVVKYLTKS